MIDTNGTALGFCKDKIMKLDKKLQHQYNSSLIVVTEHILNCGFLIAVKERTIVAKSN